MAATRRRRDRVCWVARGRAVWEQTPAQLEVSGPAWARRQAVLCMRSQGPRQTARRAGRARRPAALRAPDQAERVRQDSVQERAGIRIRRLGAGRLWALPFQTPRL